MRTDRQTHFDDSRQEVEYYRDVLRDLYNDFLWLLEQHPEHKGEYSERRIADVEIALS